MGTAKAVHQRVSYLMGLNPYDWTGNKIMSVRLKLKISLTVVKYYFSKNVGTYWTCYSLIKQTTSYENNINSFENFNKWKKCLNDGGQGAWGHQCSIDIWLGYQRLRPENKCAVNEPRLLEVAVHQEIDLVAWETHFVFLTISQF